MIAGFYVHLPFCVSKCPYCDFNSIAPPHPSYDEYLNALLVELDHRAELYSDFRFRSIYFGGGTPAIFGAERIGALIDRIRARLSFEHDPEITLEINPTGNAAEIVAGFKSAGVNRLSIGAQSFDDAALDFLGRAHCAADLLNLYNAARSANFSAVSLDFIFGLPFRDSETELGDLAALIDLGPEHISAYLLTIEPDTLFGRDSAAGNFLEIADAEAAGRFEAVGEQLGAAGYPRYEISNYAAVGRRSVHNMLYWMGEAYFGLGAGAVSYLPNRGAPGGLRTRAISSPAAYIAASAAPESLVEMQDLIELPAAQIEAIMLGLRLVDGIAIDGFSAKFGAPAARRLINRAGSDIFSVFLETVDGSIKIRRESLILAEEIIARLVAEF